MRKKLSIGSVFGLTSKTKIKAFVMSVAGSLVADKATTWQAHSATAAAGVWRVLGWCWDDAVLPSTARLFKGSSAVVLKGGDWLVHERRVARLLGQRQGLTTDDNRCGRLRGISLEGLWISSSVLLCSDAPWRVHRRGRSLVSDEPPFWRHAQPSVAAFSAAWPLCWWSPLAITLATFVT